MSRRSVGVRGLLIRRSLAGLATAAIFAAGDARAAGFQVNERHARGLGSPFAGEAASAEEDSTIFFNPRA